MILDKQLMLQDPTSTLITSSAASTNIYDAGAPRDIGVNDGPGATPMVVVTITTSFTAGGAATLQMQIQASVDSAFTTPIILGQTDAIPKASLIAGAQIKLPVPPMPPQAATGLARYYRLYWVVATGPMTAGVLEADLVFVAPQLTPIGAAGFQSGYAAGIIVNN
jgi:hypothetical protein